MEGGGVDKNAKRSSSYAGLESAMLMGKRRVFCAPHLSFLPAAWPLALFLLNKDGKCTIAAHCSSGVQTCDQHSIARAEQSGSVR